MKTNTPTEVMTSSYHPNARSFRQDSNQFKLRVNPETLEKITEIQRYHRSLDRPGSMEFAVAEAVATYYDILLAEESVRPV